MGEEEGKGTSWLRLGGASEPEPPGTGAGSEPGNSSLGALGSVGLQLWFLSHGFDLGAGRAS